MEEKTPEVLKQADSELLFVVACGIGAMVHHTLAQGANVNACDTQGRTAIMLAITRAAGERGRLRTRLREIIQILLQNGADVNRRNHAGETALGLAVRLGCKDIAKMLLAHGAEPDGATN